MTAGTGRYEAHTEGDRVICVDRLSENHAEAIIDAAQRFLDAGVARFGSLDAFDRACRWMLDYDRAVSR